jgi:hypothetical protein
MIGLLNNERLIMLVNCIACEVELDVPFSVISADPYRNDFYCNPCEDDQVARYYGLVVGDYDYEDYALASAGFGMDEDY